MRIYNLVSHLAPLGLLMTALPAVAVEEEPEPFLSPPEQVAICLLESALGVATAVVEQQGCSASVGDYDLTLKASYDGHGMAQVDGVSLRGTLTAADDEVHCQIARTGSGAGDLDQVMVTRYQGDHTLEQDATVFKGKAGLEVGGEVMEQRLSEQFGPDDEPDPGWKAGAVISGAGEDEITRPQRPVGNWQQEIRFMRPSAGPGRVLVKKMQTQASGEDATLCRLVFSAVTSDFGGGLQFFDGRLDIKKR